MNRLDKSWNPPPAHLEFWNNTADIWRANLDRPTEEIQEFRAMLSPDEQQRADRFYFDRDRHHFIVGRGILRTILGRYLNLKPSQISFRYSSRGKPTLANVGLEEKLCFNVSHSNGFALYAIAKDTSIGIDLEYMRLMPDAEQLANRFFTDRESEAIAALPPEKKQAGFFNAWTRKEAYLKATGDGLAGLQQVEVSLIPDEPAALLSINDDRTLASRWSLYDLKPHPDYAGAVAIEGNGWNVRYFSQAES